MQQKCKNVFIDLNWAMRLNIILVVVPKSNYGFLGLLCVSLNKNFGRHKNILMTNCQFFADPRQSYVSQPGEYPPCSFVVGWFINHKVGSDEMTEIQTDNSFYNLVPFKYQPPENLKKIYRSLNLFVPFLQFRWFYDNNVKNISSSVTRLKAHYECSLSEIPTLNEGTLPQRQSWNVTCPLPLCL